MDSPRWSPIQPEDGPLGYYWFLTFEDAPELHALTSACQQAIDTDYFALTPVDGLHLTLDRIAFDGAASPEQIGAIAETARVACQYIPPFTVTAAPGAKLRGAIGFGVSPTAEIRTLRGALRSATLSVLPDAPVRDSSSTPHVTIGYPMYEGLEAEAAAATARICEANGGVGVRVAEAVMVGLERRKYLYNWTVAARVSLRD
ncbi:2'-5' RNA ligase family protein [Nocardia salmonicida]|uniref:2'-5' RNA ligase family protein n=1 Tax=Nocardia salmonicida TaxID=53431 RepID=UPI0007A423A3|nr:2'-5' RNA ligase family protein [Nocardia salmonicida]